MVLSTQVQKCTSAGKIQMALRMFVCHSKTLPLVHLGQMFALK